MKALRLNPDAVKDVDPKQIAEHVALAMGYVPKQPEIGIYRERAHLVAYLATKFPAAIAYSDPDEPDWPVIYITTPHGQMSWHVAPDDLDLFPHVPMLEVDAGPVWDGHTTDEKYERLRALTIEHEPGEHYEFGIDKIMRANEQRKQASGSVSGSLAFSDATPIMTCRCGVRCFGDSINDALTAWGIHLTTLHRNEL
ncbi:hypothetical protein ACBJ59_12215 [Nonomuraea sp. MTCD27]|uniref:WDGH domain-containing protein n=1 Tax=Nonomuraea sp. MTCD27 TaxID=1676747 RepID=UPI0035BF7CA8